MVIRETCITVQVPSNFGIFLYRYREGGGVNSLQTGSSEHISTGRSNYTSDFILSTVMTPCIINNL